MNKIFIDTSNYDLVLKEETFIELKEKELNLNIEVDKKGKLNLLIDNCKLNIKVNLTKNSKLIVNSLAYNSSIDLEITLEDDSSLTYINSILSDIDSFNSIKIKHIGKNSKSKVLADGINMELGKFYFVIDGIIDKKSCNSVLEENSKIINFKEGNSKIIPNLIIDNEDVSANHSAYIGSFDKNLIWYLNARGIDDKRAKKILTKAYLLGEMELNPELDLKFKEFIEKIN